MGTKREKDSGRVDSLGRRIKESFLSRRNHRARQYNQRSRNEEISRIKEEQSQPYPPPSHSEPAPQSEYLARIIAEVDPERKFIKNLPTQEGYKKYEEEVRKRKEKEEQENRRSSKKKEKRTVTLGDPYKFYTVENDGENVTMYEHDKFIDLYLASEGIPEEYRRRYTAQVVDRKSLSELESGDSKKERNTREEKDSFLPGDNEEESYGYAQPQGGGGGGSNQPPKPPRSTGGYGENSSGNSGRFFYSQYKNGTNRDGYYRKEGNHHKGSGRSANSPLGNAFSGFEQFTGLNHVGSFRVTWRPRVGPFVFNMSRQGLSSISLDMSPMRYTLWRRDGGRGFSSLDLPSGLSFRGHKR